MFLLKCLCIATCLVVAGCASNYTLTTFYVKNNTNKTVNFQATTFRYSTAGGYNMTLPFMVLANDSVIARKAKFRNGISPTEWFTKFILFPVDSVAMNDPANPNNWIKSTDTKGNLVYTFNVAK